MLSDSHALCFTQKPTQKSQDKILPANDLLWDDSGLLWLESIVEYGNQGQQMVCSILTELKSDLLLTCSCCLGDRRLSLFFFSAFLKPAVFFLRENNIFLPQLQTQRLPFMCRISNMLMAAAHVSLSTADPVTISCLLSFMCFHTIHRSVGGRQHPGEVISFVGSITWADESIVNSWWELLSTCTTSPLGVGRKINYE